MRILIIEDEGPAVKRLRQLILNHDPEAVILAALDSIETSVRWLQESPLPDLIFMDIQLADGLSFEIFNHITVSAPVIFTTAYDQYTLKAFKVNSVDYLLKPIEPEALALALGKYKRFFQKTPVYDTDTIRQLLQAMHQPEYKERFIVKIGQQLTYINVGDIAYFFSEDGVVQARLMTAKNHLLDYTLDQLEPLLSPVHFFRINRKLLIHIQSVKKIAPFFNSRLKIDLTPPTDLEAIVSRERVGDFKSWLDK